jgi:hypothetical protein
MQLIQYISNCERKYIMPFLDTVIKKTTVKKPSFLESLIELPRDVGCKISTDTIIGQRVHQFHVKHGEDCIYIKGWYYYSDGATRDANIEGIMEEPPQDLQLKYRYQVLYHRELLQRAIKNFDDHKNHLLMHAKVNLNGGSDTPCPRVTPEEATERLRELQTIVKLRQIKLDDILAKQHEMLPNHIKNADKMIAFNREKNAELVTAIQSIEI